MFINHHQVFRTPSLLVRKFLATLKYLSTSLRSSQRCSHSSLWWKVITWKFGTSSPPLNLIDWSTSWWLSFGILLPSSIWGVTSFFFLHLCLKYSSLESSWLRCQSLSFHKILKTKKVARFSAAYMSYQNHSNSFRFPLVSH